MTTTAHTTLEIAENSIRLVQAKSDEKQIELLAMGHEPNALPIYTIETEKSIEDEAKLVEKLVSSLKIKDKNVGVIIPDALSFSQILEMPQLKEKELLSAIKYQADQFIPMPLEETALDLEIIYEDKANKKLLVLIIAASQTLVSKVEKIVEFAGLVPESIENELSATARFLSTYMKKPNQNEGIIYINFGYSTTSLYFVHPGVNLLIDTHNFKLGLNLFLKEVQTNTNFDLKKAKDVLHEIGFNQDASFNFKEILKPVTTEFLKEIETFTVSIKEKYKLNSIQHIYLTNNASAIHLLDQTIAGALSIATTYIDLSQVVKQNPVSKAYANELSLFSSALGGCLR